MLSPFRFIACLAALAALLFAVPADAGFSLTGSILKLTATEYRVSLEAAGNGENPFPGDYPNPVFPRAEGFSVTGGFGLPWNLSGTYEFTDSDVGLAYFQAPVRGLPVMDVSFDCSPPGSPEDLRLDYRASMFWAYYFPGTDMPVRVGWESYAGAIRAALPTAVGQQTTFETIPEPGSLLLMALGAIGLGVAWRRSS